VDKRTRTSSATPSPRDSASIRTSRKGLMMASSIPPFDACFCPSFFYKHNPVACFIKLHGFAYRKHGRIATLVCDNHTLTTWLYKESACVWDGVKCGFER
jgi:hypothetical protein